MTLAELIPSLRTTLNAHLDRDVWPSGTRADCTGELYLGGVPLSHVAATHGTPCHVLDLDDVALRCAEYRQTLPGVEIAYAATAFPCVELARLVTAEGLSLAAASAGELAVARRAGVPGERIIMHGDVKTAEDLKAALVARVGRVVLHSLDEIAALAELVRVRQDVLLRVDLGGGAGRRLGFAPGPEFEAAVAGVRGHPGLRLVGLHCHLGGRITSAAPYETAAEHLVRLLGAVDVRGGQLNLGGGHGIRHGAGQDALSVLTFANRVVPAVHRAARELGVEPPALTVEPGRALVGPGAVALYRVAEVEHRHGGHTVVAVDGRLGEDPRPTARVVGRPLRALSRPAMVVGRQHPPGAPPADGVPLPEDVRAGDLLAVPACGAYRPGPAHDLVGRGPVVGVRGGETRLLLRRETEDELLARDVSG